MKLRHIYELVSDFKGIMNERFSYYSKLISLKWDAWLYITGAQLILLLIVLIPIILAIIFFAMHSINSFNNPFRNIEITYNIISALIIVILLVLNLCFIFRKKNIKEDKDNKLLYNLDNNGEIVFLRHILVISILGMIFLIIAFLLVNSNIMSNIELFTQANIDKVSEFTDLFVDYTGVFKFVVILKQIIPILIILIIIGLEIIWIKRLDKYRINEKKTDILMDEEENVKF